MSERRAREQRRIARQGAAERAKLAAEARTEARKHGAEEGRKRGCLFCRQSDGGFTSEEHILPEGLGNTEFLLPVGVVCDRCNHGPLSRLDESLTNFMPIEMLRTFHGIPSKKGTLPSFKFDNGSLRCVGPDELALNLDSKRFHREQPAPEGKVSWQFDAKRHDTSPARLSKVHRALVKIVVEFVWSDMGEEKALGPDLDHARELVLRGGHHGYLAIPKTNDPSPQIQVQYAPRTRVADGHPLLAILISFWGLSMFTDTLFDQLAKNVRNGMNLLTF